MVRYMHVYTREGIQPYRHRFSRKVEEDEVQGDKRVPTLGGLAGGPWAPFTTSPFSHSTSARNRLISTCKASKASAFEGLLTAFEGLLTAGYLPCDNLAKEEGEWLVDRTGRAFLFLGNLPPALLSSCWQASSAEELSETCHCKTFCT